MSEPQPPSLYEYEPLTDDDYIVTYNPENGETEVLCTVHANDLEHPEDSWTKASVIAHSLNITVDMTAWAMQELFEAYEELYGERHRNDWRPR